MMKQTKKMISIIFIFAFACITVLGLTRSNIVAQEPGALVLFPVTKDTYIHKDRIANMTQAEFLFETKLSILYSIEGGNQHWDREDTSSVQAIQMFMDLNQLSINEADWQAFKNLNKGIGGYSLEVTFYSKLLEENGFVDPIAIASADISVVDDATSYDPDFSTTAGAAIHLKNFEYPLAQAQAMNEELIRSIPEGEFRAWDGTSAAAVVGNVSLEPGKDLSYLTRFSNENIAGIQTATKTGAYTMNSEITYLDDFIQTHKSTIYLTNENTKVDRINDVIVFAEDFTITLEEAKALTVDSAMRLGNVHAYKYSKGEALIGNIALELSEVTNATKSTIVDVPVTYLEQGVQVSISMKVTIIGADEEKIVPMVHKDTGVNVGVPTGDTNNSAAFVLMALISGFVLIKMKKHVS